MRQRVAFFHRPESPVDPASLKITETSLTGPAVVAARQDRITLALDELPAELRRILGGTHELYIRWVSPYNYESISPLFSRLPPGLHVFYTPRQEGADKSDELCLLLKKAFGKLDCSTPKASFVALPVDRFSHSAAFQYYQPLEDLSALIKYVRTELCPADDPLCDARVDRLDEATSFDLSYDTISHALRVEALWAGKTQPLLVTSPPGARTEVGILAADKPPSLEAYELGIAGHLAVLGQDEKPSATLFSFASRHRHAESVFESTFLQPTGLHPTMQLRFTPGKALEEDAYCSLHAYLTLPRIIFADKYQLGDPLFLASKNLTALRHTTQPVDLEAPDYAMDVWGSAVLLELAPPETAAAEWTAEIPLHLRYLSPASGGYRGVEIPYPAVFWACAAEEGTKFPTNPFDRVNLGYDGLFGPRTVFWHVDPKPAAGDRLTNTIRVPVLDLAKAQWVNLGTGAVVLLGFCWIVWKLLAGFLKTGYGAAAAPGSKGEEKKKQ